MTKVAASEIKVGEKVKARTGVVLEVVSTDPEPGGVRLKLKMEDGRELEDFYGPKRLVERFP